MKKENWQNKLNDYIDKRQNRPFKWGSNDCIMFSVGAIEAMTGVNHAKKYPNYRTKKEAYNVIKDCFNGDTDIVFDTIIGESKENINFAKHGDIICVIINDEKAYGVVADDGRSIWLVGETKGIIKYKISEGIKFWQQQ